MEDFAIIFLLSIILIGVYKSLESVSREVDNELRQKNTEPQCERNNLG